jgi:hypothetical protein
VWQLVLLAGFDQPLICRGLEVSKVEAQHTLLYLPCSLFRSTPYYSYVTAKATESANRRMLFCHVSFWPPNHPRIQIDDRASTLIKDEAGELDISLKFFNYVAFKL